MAKEIDSVSEYKNWLDTVSPVVKQAHELYYDSMDRAVRDEYTVIIYLLNYSDTFDEFLGFFKEHRNIDDNSLIVEAKRFYYIYVAGMNRLIKKDT